jgi:hypothetical protein
MTAREKLDLWLVVDANGDYDVRNDRDAALEAYVEMIGGNEIRALYHLVVDAPLPATREVSVALADNAPAEIIVTVVE